MREIPRVAKERRDTAAYSGQSYLGGPSSTNPLYTHTRTSARRERVKNPVCLRPFAAAAKSPAPRAGAPSPCSLRPLEK